MSQLTFASIPGFFDLADTAIAAGQPLTDDSISKISHNAKFGVVRAEQLYMGFYTNGNVVPTPVSPVDGYAYSRNEVIYRPRLASSRQPDSSFVPGQFFFPSLAFSDTGSGNLIVVPHLLYVVGQLSSGGYAPHTVPWR